MWNSESKTSDPKPIKKVEVKLIRLHENQFITMCRVSPWTTVFNLKEKLYDYSKFPVKSQNFFYHNILLANHKELFDYGIGNTKDTCSVKIYVALDESYLAKTAKVHLIDKTNKIPRLMKVIIEEIEKGFNSGFIPKLTFEGTSGTYLLSDHHKNNKGVFKPVDEEAYAPNNPRGLKSFLGTPLPLKGILSGEACIREVAAYLLNKDGFLGVPETCLVWIIHPSFKYSGETENGMQAKITRLIREISAIIPLPETDESSKKEIGQIKIGSLQRFVESFDIAENLSGDLFPVDEVHKIGILDIRIINTDRQSNNLLVVKSHHSKKWKKKEPEIYRLVPIDHGISLPDSFQLWELDFCWLSWSQINVPFSPDSLQYIASIDIMKDIEELNKSLKIRSICLRNMRISNTLLKMGARKGLTLGEIARIWCRTDDEGVLPSVLEKVISRAREQADNLYTKNKNVSNAPEFDFQPAAKAAGIEDLIKSDTIEHSVMEIEEDKVQGREEKRERAFTQCYSNINTDSEGERVNLYKQISAGERKIYVKKEIRKVEYEEEKKILAPKKVPDIFDRDEVYYVQPIVVPEEGIKFKRKKKKRSSSIPARLGNTEVVDEEILKEMEEEKETKEAKKQKLKNNSPENNLRDTPYDEDFFRCFEGLLAYEIEHLKANRKPLKK